MSSQPAFGGSGHWLPRCCKSMTEKHTDKPSSSLTGCVTPRDLHGAHHRLLACIVPSLQQFRAWEERIVGIVQTAISESLGGLARWTIEGAAKPKRASQRRRRRGAVEAGLQLSDDDTGIEQPVPAPRSPSPERSRSPGLDSEPGSEWSHAFGGGSAGADAGGIADALSGTVLSAGDPLSLRNTGAALHATLQVWRTFAAVLEQPHLATRVSTLRLAFAGAVAQVPRPTHCGAATVSSLVFRC